jgi:UDP-2,4-diacetamido-2,4,6-trideoxy-beta-L-altropyranose hydrolase
MVKYTIFVRVDSGYDIGFGHAMRCLSLAQTLKKMNFEICFISKKERGNISKLFEDKGFTVYYIQNNYSKSKKNDIIKNDVNQTVKIIAKHKAKSSWMIVDHYDLDFKWEKRLRKFVDKIIVIDDLVRKHDCDLLLDQNYNKNLKTRYDKLVPRKCIKLLGPKYALLRDEFPILRKNVKPRKNFKRILISFGGSDPTNETGKVLSAIKILKTNKQFLEVNVVIGKSDKNKHKIKQLCNSIPNAKLYESVYNIGKLMCKADLAVGAGGSSTLERLCLGLPSIVSIIATNQEESTMALGKKGYIINLGSAKNLTIKKYVEIFENLDIKKLQSISRNSLNVVDGKGGMRVAKTIMRL